MGRVAQLGGPLFVEYWIQYKYILYCGRSPFGSEARICGDIRGGDSATSALRTIYRVTTHPLLELHFDRATSCLKPLFLKILLEKVCFFAPLETTSAPKEDGGLFLSKAKPRFVYKT